jgi:antitoxin component YwqK of YwqJK toxin-antitoxin module
MKAILKIEENGKEYEYNFTTSAADFEPSYRGEPNYGLWSLKSELNKAFRDHNLISDDHYIGIEEKKNGIHYEYFPPIISHGLTGKPNYKCRLRYETCYKNGYQHGDQKTWHPHGYLRYCISYYEGQKTHYIEYHSNGKKKMEGCYKKWDPEIRRSEIQEGVWTTWNSWGKKVKEERYSNGELIA